MASGREDMRSLVLDNKCLCPRCQHMVAHIEGEPCSLRKCPNCEGKMTRTLSEGGSLVDIDNSSHIIYRSKGSESILDHSGDPAGVIKTSGTRHYQHYDVRTEIVKPSQNKARTMNMRSAYSKEGDYIGSAILAHRLVNVHGIQKFEKADSDDNICSVGFSPSKNEWLGWSHRGIHGFGIGSKLKKARAVNMSQAKRMAVAFARGIA